ncbi:NTP transferase domain-containing protein [bacterium]|nr:NTP transferase domain-containing protein [bacterium]
MKPGQKLVGAILAAGKGSRLQPLSEAYPKPLLPICNKPIVGYQLDYMKGLGITDVYIVVGELGDMFERQFGDGSGYGMKLHYLTQESQLGIAHAVMKLEQYISSPFMLFLGDIFIISHTLDDMVKQWRDHGCDAVLAVKPDTPDNIMRNFAIVLNDGGRVTRVIEKPRYPVNDLKGCGIYLFDVSIFDAIRRTPRTAMRDEYEITESIQIYIEDGHPVYVSHALDDDINITFPEDMIDCCIREMKHRGVDKIIGTDAFIRSDPEIKWSVIGDNAVIDGDGPIEECVVFPNTRVMKEGPIKRMIFTPEYELKF